MSAVISGTVTVFEKAESSSIEVGNVEVRLSPEGLENISRRDRKVVELMNLWTRRQLLTGGRPTKGGLNRFIDERFETKYGIDSLTFDSFNELIALFKTEILLSE